MRFPSLAPTPLTFLLPTVWYVLHRNPRSYRRAYMLRVAAQTHLFSRSSSFCGRQEGRNEYASRKANRQQGGVCKGARIAGRHDVVGLLPARVVRWKCLRCFAAPYFLSLRPGSSLQSVREKRYRRDIRSLCACCSHSPICRWLIRSGQNVSVHIGGGRTPEQCGSAHTYNGSIPSRS